jgi:hypothetical protein
MENQKKYAEFISQKMWHVHTERRKVKPNMRQCVQVATISGNDKAQIDKIINALDKYSTIYD